MRRFLIRSFPIRRAFARRALARFRRHYGYDTTYMETMLNQAPAAFFDFAKILPVSRHRDVVSKEAYYAVKIVAATLEDCGPCTQLAVNMARESGVDQRQIEAVVAGDLESMGSDTRTGFLFAQAAGRPGTDAHPAREEVRARWGEAGVVELSLCLAIGRVFPAIKNAMGLGQTCQRVQVGPSPVEVWQRAG